MSSRRILLVFNNPFVLCFVLSKAVVLAQLDGLDCAPCLQYACPLYYSAQCFSVMYL